MPRTAKNPGANAGRKVCRYTCDHWVAEERFGTFIYVKVTALQWERATDDSFNLAARRKMQRILEDLGYDRGLALGIGALTEWDRSRNLADLLTDTMTFRLTNPLPVLEDASLEVA